MSDIRIEALPGEYSNDDVYEKLLGYISNKRYIGGFGFTCRPDLPIITQFRSSERYSSSYTPDSRKMWHFIITFSTAWGHSSLIQHAVTVSRGFAPEYQILWGLDLEGTPHLHFGVNAYSYHPDHPVLLEERMHKYLIQLQEHLQQLYPNMTVTLQFLNKGEQYV